MVKAPPATIAETSNPNLVAEVADLLCVTEKYLGGWVLNRIRQDGAIDAYVPLKQIDVSNVPTDPRNVDRLVGLFNKHAAEVGGGTGQRDAVVLGNVPKDALYMLDGFHRYETQDQRGETHLLATVEPRLTYDQVVGRRLEYAHAHAEVEFPRQVEWVQSAWERTPWFKDIPNVLTAFRAFEDDYAYTVADDEELELIDSLSDEDFDAINVWVDTQCKAWGYKPKEIRENLIAVEAFDRELLPYVYKGRGALPVGRIGLRHVEIITTVYPGEYDMQQAAIEVILDKGLNAKQAEALITEIEKTNPRTRTSFLKTAKAIDLQEVKDKVRTKARTSNGGGASRSSAASEVKSELSVSQRLLDVRQALPDIQAYALDGNFGPADIENALEISRVFEEIAADYAAKP